MADRCSVCNSILPSGGDRYYWRFSSGTALLCDPCFGAVKMMMTGVGADAAADAEECSKSIEAMREALRAGVGDKRISDEVLRLIDVATGGHGTHLDSYQTIVPLFPKEKTRYFQHERFVHLFVMILFALCTVACFLVIVVTENVLLIPLAALFLALLIPYISHYYFLENKTQLLYRYYDRISEKLGRDDL